MTTTPTHDDVALKPCPFCGCDVQLIVRREHDQYMGPRDWFYIEGKHDGIGGVCPGQVRGRGSKETAIAAWNTRVHDATIAALNARVAESEALLNDWCTAAMIAAGCDENVSEDQAESDVLIWGGSVIGSVYNRTRDRQALAGEASDANG